MISNYIINVHLNHQHYHIQKGMNLEIVKMNMKRRRKKKGRKGREGIIMVREKKKN